MHTQRNMRRKTSVKDENYSFGENFNFDWQRQDSKLTPQQFQSAYSTQTKPPPNNGEKV